MAEEYVGKEQFGEFVKRMDERVRSCERAV